MSPDEPCVCPGPGYCEKFGLVQQAYPHRVCQGLEGEDKGRRYRAKWSKAARKGSPLRVPLPTAPPRELAPSPPDKASSGTPSPRGGPGTELKALLASLGLSATAGCGCGDRSRAMDRGGVAWCESHREEILGWLRAAAAKTGWAAKLKAAALAALTGVAFRFDPLNPVEGLLDEAIRRHLVTTSSVTSRVVTDSSEV